MFESEVAAWRKVGGSTLLRQHTPGFYGARTVTGVNAATFLLQCCYEMDFVEGSEQKVGEAGWGRPHLARAVDEFKLVGISFYKDASCFNIEDATDFKLIDFAE